MTKFIKNISIGVWLSALALLFVTIHSCKKEDVSKPVITRVRPTSANLADSTIEKALPGTFLVIEGKNLQNAQKILFNGYPAIFNPTYNTDSHIIVQIPIDTPTPDAKPDVPNTIVVITPQGEVTFSFAVNPPPPFFNYVYNYNTLPGAVMEIYGKFLLGVNEITFPGNKLGTNISKNKEGTILYVTVPDLAATDIGPIIIKSPYGNVTTPFSVNNTNTQGVFANFEPATPETGCGCWYGTPANVPTMDNTMYPNSTGSYFRLYNPNTVGPGINNSIKVSGRSYNFSGSSTKVVLDPAKMTEKPDDYYLLFEMNTKAPITGGVLRIAFGLKWDSNGGVDDYQYDYLPWADQPNSTFNTNNKWYTVSLPLKNFGTYDFNWNTYNANKITPISTIGELLRANGTVPGFGVKLYVTSTSGSLAPFDAAFDNFRIEKIAK